MHADIFAFDEQPLDDVYFDFKGGSKFPTRQCGAIYIQCHVTVRPHYDGVQLYHTTIRIVVSLWITVHEQLKCHTFYKF